MFNKGYGNKTMAENLKVNPNYMDQILLDLKFDKSKNQFYLKCEVCGEFYHYLGIQSHYKVKHNLKYGELKQQNQKKNKCLICQKETKNTKLCSAHCVNVYRNKLKNHKFQQELVLCH